MPLPLPSFVDWKSFPFEGDLRVRDLIAPVDTEPPRSGEPGGLPCHACNRPDDDFIWVDDNWRVSAAEPNGLPTQVFLETRAHLDQDQFDDDLASEYGRLIVRLDRALQAIGGVGRVHVSRWGDGGSHFHMWLFARPYGHMQLAGTFLALWADILPPADLATWNANLKIVAFELAKGGGRAVLV